tara:strand:+ start:2029 stop:2346 length:318 start_codon:yes stop_codon:yes gene_type:complete
VLVPAPGEVAAALDAPRLLLLIGQGGCVRCTDLSVAAAEWSSEHRRCVLVHLDDEAGRETAGIHPFLAHLDVLPAVVPIERGSALDVVYGHGTEALERAWAMLEA